MKNLGEYIVFYQLPQLDEAGRLDLLYRDSESEPWGSRAQVSSLSWTRDSKTLYYCQYGLVYSVHIDSENGPEAFQQIDLVFELCCCNPVYDVIALGQAPPKDTDASANQEPVPSKISIRRISDNSVISEFNSSAGVMDLRWSADGTKLWALCKNGTAVQAELPETVIAM